MAQNPLLDFPEDFFCCPVCAAQLTELQCSNCNSQFFALGDIPCLFTTGIEQKNLWQHQMAMMEKQGAEAIEHIEYVMQGYDVTARTRDRLEQAHQAMQQSLEVIIGQLKNAGLISQFSAALQGQNVDNPTEYYHHILRDWAWDDEPNKHFVTHVNDANLERVKNVWPGQNKAGKMLFLGAGAGRISWDVHCWLKPQLSIATDINPFLLTSANTLIKQRQNLTLPELYTYPQVGFPYAKSWQMAPPPDPENLHKNWFALGADVWNMPFAAGSFDSIVTSWLLDVTGGDVKELIAVIDYLLAPGGTWLNTGPLLYSSQLAFDMKYSADEIFEFAQMSGFEVNPPIIDEIAHMASPLNARYHHEQIISFSAVKKSSEKPLPSPSLTSDWLTPPWLVMHHQPIPNIKFECQIGHEFIQQVLNLVDGQKSIYLLAQIMQPQVPAGVDAKDAIVAMFGQILEQMAQQD